MKITIRNTLIILAALFISVNSTSQNSLKQGTIISVTKIWDRAGHNAFTSLVYFNGRFYCAFREGGSHTPLNKNGIFINGGIRILMFDDGENWKPAAHIFKKDVDLRDPKLAITPGNKIMLLMGGSVYDKNVCKSSNGWVSFFTPGTGKITQPRKINIDKKIKTNHDWLWNVTWHDKTAYGVIYQGVKNQLNNYSAHLVKSADGINYEYVSSLEVTTSPTEADVKFLDTGEMVIIIRGNPGAVGVSSPPFKIWKWNALPVNLGGPEFLVLENNTLICATREYNEGNANRTILAKVSLSGDFKKLLTLPSGGDTSYAGMVLKDGILYISYYSSHEGQTSEYTAKREKGVGKTSIYLAKIWADKLLE